MHISFAKSVRMWSVARSKLFADAIQRMHLKVKSYKIAIESYFHYLLEKLN